MDTDNAVAFAPRYVLHLNSPKHSCVDLHTMTRYRERPTRRQLIPIIGEL